MASVVLLSVHAAALLTKLHTVCALASTMAGARAGIGIAATIATVLILPHLAAAHRAHLSAVVASS